MTGSQPRLDPAAVLAASAGRLAADGAGALGGVVALLAGALSVPATVVVRRADAAGPGPIVATSAAATAVPRMRPADSAAISAVPVLFAGRVVGQLVVLGERELSPDDVALVTAHADLAALALTAGQSGADTARHVLDEEAGRAEVASALQEGPLAALVAARYAVDRGAEDDLLRAVVDQALQELRTVLGTVRPRGLDTDLARSLRSLADDLGRAGCQVDVQTRGGDPAGLAPAHTVVAYRVAAAALAGVSGPATVVVDAGGGSDRFTLTVRGARNPHDAGALDRWASRARALDGLLRREPDGVVLQLPIHVPISSSSGVLR